MPTNSFTCICSNVLSRPESQSDFKCAVCGRVYNYQGRFLWQESAGNDNPGSSDIAPTGVGQRAEDKSADPEASIKALETAFEEGKLPEEPRRRSDEDLAQDKADETETAAINVMAADRASRRKK